MLKRFLVVLVLVALAGLGLRSCLSTTVSSRHLIAYDPSWYPIQTVSKSENLNAFSRELVEEIARKQDLDFRIAKASSEGLIRSLVNEQVDGILSAVEPTVVTEARFRLSDSYFDIGPVLVVANLNGIQGMADLVGRNVGILSGSSRYIAILSDGLVTVTPYDNLTQMLDALVRGEVSAVLMSRMSAVAHSRGTYRGRIRLASDSLTEEGLRLVMIHNSDPEVVDKFNKELRLMKEDGRYDALLERWRLP